MSHGRGSIEVDVISVEVANLTTGALTVTNMVMDRLIVERRKQIEIDVTGGTREIDHHEKIQEITMRTKGTMAR